MSKELEYEFFHVCCDRHGEPFRKKWPAAWPTFVVLAHAAILGREDFCLEAGGKLFNVLSLLDKKPICCRLSPEELLRLFLDANLKLNSKGTGSPWKIARCQGCQKKRLGSPYQLKNRRGTQVYDHFCFHCMIYGLKPDPSLN